MANGQNPKSGSGLSVNSNARTARRTEWDEDDYNQDPYGDSESGRVFGSGIAPKSASKWSQPTTSGRTYSSTPSVPPSASSKGTFSQPAQPAKPKEQQFKPGQKVRHSLFGEGVILKSEMESGTEFVEVQFQGRHGKKRLSMDFAKLEKI
jgi:DNA helicase-2/ATP-dependent DNA helicase PcrA